MHDADASREGEELMGYLARPGGVDEKVQYVLGTLFLARTSTASGQATAAQVTTASAVTAVALQADKPPDWTRAWILLAPLYFRAARPFDRPVRDVFRQLYCGPDRLSRAAREQRQADALADLGTFLLVHRTTAGQAAFGQSAAAVLRLAAGHLGTGHPRRPAILCSLGYALITGDLALVATGEAAGEMTGVLREAADVLREALRLTPADDLDHARCANGLGLALALLSEDGRNRDQLAEAAGLLRIAIGSATEGHYDNFDQMHFDLGRMLATWVRWADPAQARDDAVARAADEAVTELRRAVDLTPAADQRRAARLNRLAWAEQVRLDRERVSDTSDVDEVRAVIERRLAEPEPAPGSLEHHALQISLQYLQMVTLIGSASPGTESSLAAQAQAEELTQEVQDSVPRLMELVAAPGVSLEDFYAFGRTWLSPFGGFVLLNEAMGHYRGLLAELPPATPEAAQARTSLAFVLFLRAGIASDEDGYLEAVSLARDLVATAWPPPPALLGQWGQVAAGRRTVALATWSNPDLRLPAGGRDRLASPVTQIATNLASAALAEDNAAAALEALEEGQSYLLSSALDNRRELEALRGSEADLYARLVAIDEEFLSWQRDAVIDRMGHVPSPEEMEWYRTRTAEGISLVEELRRRPGFDRFLMPRQLSLADLQPAADGGPVISVNVDPRRCDALILTTDGPVALPLPRLSAAGLAEQADAFQAAVEALVAGGSQADAARSVFTGVLGWLWDVLAEPVLDALGYAGPPAAGSPWPRIWWSPTGLLNALPLHAAGHHEVPGAAVLDRVASSYTPTLRALLASRARADRARTARNGQDRRVLAVAIPYTPGYAPLATAAREAAAAAGTDGLCLTGPGATRKVVLTALPDAAIVHFACHARSDPGDPSASCLILPDGELPISDLTRLRLDRAELAYLSACGTTRGGTALAGESIHLASAFQLAGYSQSVATGWEIADRVAATAATRFHQLLAPALLSRDPLPAALALHATVRELRETYRSAPWTWAALVHAGA